MPFDCCNVVMLDIHVLCVYFLLEDWKKEIVNLNKMISMINERGNGFTPLLTFNYLAVFITKMFNVCI